MNLLDALSEIRKIGLIPAICPKDKWYFIEDDILFRPFGLYFPYCDTTIPYESIDIVEGMELGAEYDDEGTPFYDYQSVMSIYINK